MTTPNLTTLKNRAKRQGWAKYIRSEADERAMLNGCTFDKQRAEHVVDFFAKFLRHSKGQWAGQPFELLDWQREDLIFPLFGWVRPTGFRRFTKAYVELPKKNGKSSLAAAIGLYLLAGDGEEGAEVYSAATAREQASIVHGEAVRMVDASPELSDALTINRSTFNIAFPESRSYYRALSAVASSSEGLNAHGIVADELHVWHGRALWDALKYAFRARRQGLLFAITTAGDDPTSVCYEQHEYTKAVNAGTIEDDRHFGYIRAAEPTDDWTDPKVWAKANPSLGEIILLDDMQSDCNEAQKSPTTQASFKRYNLNLWQSSTNPWLDVHRWHSNAATFTENDLAGRPCYGGLDLAIKSDTTALSLIFPWEQKPNGEQRYRLLTWFWLPQATADRQATLVPWKSWERGGHITLTPGDVCDFQFVRARIVDFSRKFRLQGLAFDRTYAHVLAQQLQDEDGIKMAEFPQTIMAFAEPTAAFERLVIAGDIEHNANPVLDWQMGNVNVKRDVNNNIRPVKPPDGEHRKIDGAVSSIMALALALQDEFDDGMTVYERENRSFIEIG
jgi:phage terminase large subunit-like protein